MYPMLPFAKFHGTGNDFVLVDNRIARQFSTKRIRLWCDRHLGIGADGFILLENDTQGADFKMRYFNADGNEASLCGNGSRCAVAFANYLGIIEKKAAFSAFDGIHRAEIVKRESSYQWDVALQMKDITSIEKWDDGYFTDTGSPHFVSFTEDVQKVNVPEKGKELRNDKRFVDGCNANFASVNKGKLELRTYERGVEDETLSCGTGAVAAAVIWAFKEKRTDGPHTIPILTRGGQLEIDFIKKGKRFEQIYLKGPAIFAFSGEIPIEDNQDLSYM